MQFRVPPLALVTTTGFLLMAVSNFSRPARASDVGPAAHEAAVLDRIFANWKARHDRVHSFHFTWDCRTTCRKGSRDFSSDLDVRFDRDQVFQQVGVQFWMDGDGRQCLVRTPTFKVPQVKVVGSGPVVNRWVIDGKTTLRFFARSEFESGSAPPRPLAPYGLLYPHAIDDQSIPDPTLFAMLLTFRPQAPAISWLREQCHLVDEHAAVDNGHFVKFQRVVQREEACWVSPARDDVVVHWAIQSEPSSRWEGLIRYAKDKSFGWVPSEWSHTFGTTVSEYKVTSYAINEAIDPKTFSLEFPAGTPVQEQSPTAKHKHYVVQRDGRKRPIPVNEFMDLAGFVVHHEKPIPAKPPAK
jgi:hypothetical protein